VPQPFLTMAKDKKDNKDLWYKQENLERLTETEAKFIFDQAEKLLKETNDSGTLVTARTTSLLTLTSGFLIALIGFSINRWETKNHLWDILLIIAMSISVYILFCVFILSLNIFGFVYSALGSEPKPFLNDTFFSYPDTEGKQRIIHYYRNEFIQYQNRIDKNKRLNIKRWRNYKIALIMVLLTPVLIAVSYWIITTVLCRLYCS
jgi:hypothetical protein